jgi:PAS domain S-box-containing protein
MGTLKQQLSYLILGQKGGQNRIEIINLLKERPYNLNQMSEILKLNYRTIKHHVDVLLKNELINSSRTGSYGEVYFLSPELEGNMEIFDDVVTKFNSSDKLRDFTSSPKFFRNLMEQTNEAVVIINNTNQIFFWNESAEKLFDRAREEVIGENLKTIEELLSYEDILSKAKLGKKITNFETQLEHRNGNLIELSSNIDLIKDNDGQIIGYSILSRDISDRKRAEEALIQSEQRYALAQKAANIGSWDWNIISGDLKWSDTIEPMFGFERGKFGGTYEAFLDCVHPEDRQFVIDSVNACVEDDQEYDIEHRIIHPDGNVRIVSETGSVFRDKNNKPIRMLGIVQDITDRKGMEDTILEKEKRYHDLFENFPISLWEEDFSDVKKCLDELRDTGVKDFQDYFLNHPESVKKCVEQVKIIDINQTTLQLYQADNKEQLLDNLNKVFDSKSYEIFRDEIIALAQGKTNFESKAVNRTLKGESIKVQLKLAVPPGYEETLSRVLVSIIGLPGEK